MHTRPSLRFISLFLSLIMLAMAIGGLHAHACGTGDHSVVSAHTPATSPDSGAPDPIDHEHHEDGCSSCLCCFCHPPLTVQTFSLSHTPLMLRLTPFEPFTHLPEVYLSRFIPPQIHA